MEFLPLAAIALIFWFLLIRPESKRRKKVQEMQSQLRVGDAILLSAGIFGTITRIDEESGKVAVAVADGVELEVARGAIAGLQDDQLRAGLEEPGLEEPGLEEPGLEEPGPDAADPGQDDARRRDN